MSRIPPSDISPTPCFGQVHDRFSFRLQHDEDARAMGVLTVKADVGDAVLCVQKLNLAIAATSGDLQGAQEAHAVAFSGDEESPRGSTSASPKLAHFKEDPKMTKKVALTHDGSRSITIGTRLTDK